MTVFQQITTTILATAIAAALVFANMPVGG